ncbi:hypothetical protein PFISCL1PPCAC_14323, partial [Pristionchus fissidentatus]
MFASSLLTLSLGLLSLAQFLWFRSERVGFSDSKLNNAYGLIASLDALLTPSLVYARHRGLKAISEKRINKELEQTPISSEEYLKQFEEVWKLTWMKTFDVGDVLAIIEFVVNCFAQIALVLAVHSITLDKNLHGNFRFVMCLFLSRTLLNGARRTVANYLTLFYIGELSTQFLDSYRRASIFSGMLLATSMPTLAIERVLYTYNVWNYKERRTTKRSLVVCFVCVVRGS